MYFSTSPCRPSIGGTRQSNSALNTSTASTAPSSAVWPMESRMSANRIAERMVDTCPRLVLPRRMARCGSSPT